jgi:hypothetical protein
MNLALLLGLFALGAAAIIIALALRRRRRSRADLPPRVTARQRVLRQRLAEIILRVPTTPRLSSGEVPDHPRAASIEAKLLSGNPQAALSEAEDLLARSPQDVRVRVLLARVLIHCNELRAASYELTRARGLGGSGPMLDYLEGRAHHLQLHSRTSPGDRAQAWAAEIITPFELFILQLRQQRSRKAAIAVATARSTSARGARPIEPHELETLLIDHFSAYYDCLEKLVTAVESEPGFSDALYHTARLALKAGFTDEGLALMRKIAPLMDASPERSSYARDLRRLRGEMPEVVSAPTAPTARAAHLPVAGSGASRDSSPKMLN